jgi:hypothetical protein
MSKENYENNNNIYRKRLEDFTKPFWLYEPDNTYWESSLKIVFCNLEAATGERVNEESDSDHIIRWETLKNNWMDLYDEYRRDKEDRTDYPNPVIWRSIVFAYILYKRLIGISREDFEKILEKVDDDILVKYPNPRPEKLFNALGKNNLEEVIQRIMYTNLNKFVNENEDTSFDAESLNKFMGDTRIRECTLDSIKYSDADIFIISGQEGVKALNKLINGLNLDLIIDKDPKTGMKEHGNTIFVTAYHPAQGKYYTLKWILNRTDEIVNKFNKLKKEQ